MTIRSKESYGSQAHFSLWPVETGHESPCIQCERSRYLLIANHFRPDVMLAPLYDVMGLPGQIVPGEQAPHTPLPREEFSQYPLPQKYIL